MYSYKNDSICYKMSTCFAVLQEYIHFYYHYMFTPNIKPIKKCENEQNHSKNQDISLKENEIVINIKEIIKNDRNMNDDKNMNDRNDNRKDNRKDRNEMIIKDNYFVKEEEFEIL